MKMKKLAATLTAAAMLALTLLNGCKNNNETVIAKGNGWTLVQENDPSHRVNWSEISNAPQSYFKTIKSKEGCKVSGLATSTSVYLLRIPKKIAQLDVTSLGDRAFYNLADLQAVFVPDGVQEIHGNCFTDCSSLSEVRLPDSLASLSSNAFDGCREVIISYKGNEYTYAEIDRLIDLINKQ